MKPFVMLKNVGQNVILLTINHNRPNISLITKNTPFWGDSASKDRRTSKNLEAFFIAKLKPPFIIHDNSNMLTLLRNGVTELSLLVCWTETYSKLTIKILGECLLVFLFSNFLLVSFFTNFELEFVDRDSILLLTLTFWF